MAPPKVEKSDLTRSESDAEAIFFAAAKGSRDEQARHVEEACGGDAVLCESRRAVAECPSATGILDSCRRSNLPWNPRSIRPISSRLPAPHWPLQAARTIGEGGMGTVFMAEQTTPVHRKEPKLPRDARRN